MKLVVKADHSVEIAGTLERCPGVALLHLEDCKTLPDGKIEIAYAGETKMFWDDQYTVTRNKERVFVDRDGTEYLESEIELIEDEEPEDEDEDS